MSNRVLVTPRSMSADGHPSLRRVQEAGFELVFPSPGKQPTEEELINHTEGVVGYIAGVEAVSGRFLRTAKDLKVISRNGTGIDNIDLDVAKELNIKVLRAEGANARGVAELALIHILLLKRGLFGPTVALKRHEWQRTRGGEVEGLRLAVLGMGNIGSRVAVLARDLGMNVIVHDPFPSERARKIEGISWLSFEKLLTEAEILTLHAPPAEDGRPVIGREQLKSMVPGILIVNSARASLVNDAAVLEALNSGQVAGYAVDAFTEEPPRNWELIDHPSVLATPHLGGYTEESVNRAAEAAVLNLLRGLK